MNDDRKIDTWMMDPANSLDDLSGKEFDANFDSFCIANEISRADCEKWAEDFQNFLADNASFIVCAEQARILSRFFKL